MKISVIVPCFNEEKYVKACLDSIFSQTFKDYEVIFVDDCSTDKSTEIAKTYPLKYIRNESNKGIAMTRQIGVDAATGDYISFLSADDIWQSNFLEKMAAVAETNPNAIVFCKYGAIDDKEKVVGSFEPPKFTSQIQFRSMCIQHAKSSTMFVNFDCVLIPRQVFNKVKFWKDLVYGEDIQFLLETALMHHIEYVYLNESLVNYRLHNQNTTSKNFSLIADNNKNILRRINEISGVRFFDI